VIYNCVVAFCFRVVGVVVDIYLLESVEPTGHTLPACYIVAFFLCRPNSTYLCRAITFHHQALPYPRQQRSKQKLPKQHTPNSVPSLPLSVSQTIPATLPYLTLPYPTEQTHTLTTPSKSSPLAPQTDEYEKGTLFLMQIAMSVRAVPVFGSRPPDYHAVFERARVAAPAASVSFAH
jgi:hypothetical protein